MSSPSQLPGCNWRCPITRSSAETASPNDGWVTVFHGKINVESGARQVSLGSGHTSTKTQTSARPRSFRARRAMILTNGFRNGIRLCPVLKVTAVCRAGVIPPASPTSTFLAHGELSPVSAMGGNRMVPGSTGRRLSPASGCSWAIRDGIG